MALRGLSTDIRYRSSRPIRWLRYLISVVLLTSAASAAAAEPKRDPSFTHGLGQVIWGLTFELPKTVLEATMTGPPVVGTAVGLLAGASGAIQKTIEGLVEMAAGFNPFGTKTTRRRR